jgi:hypothetical protein
VLGYEKIRDPGRLRPVRNSIIARPYGDGVFLDRAVPRVVLSRVRIDHEMLPISRDIVG